MSEVCTIEECTGKHVARGLCSKHYYAARNRGELETRRVKDGSQGCKIEECERTHYSLGYCRKHYERFRRNGNPETPERAPTFCECGEKAVGRGMCKRHYMRDYYKRNPDKLEALREASRNYVRPEGLPLRPLKNVVGYFQAHRRVAAIRGKATNYTCDCGAQAKEWALIHGRGTHTEDVRGYESAYSLDVSDYQPMCVKCHRNYDRSAAA